MNHTRRSTGTVAIGAAEAAYQRAASYVKERRQGRAPRPTGERTEPADPLIEQPDVRRILMHIRAIVQGGRALNFWTGIQTDILDRSADVGMRLRAQRLLQLITPVTKAFLSDQAFDCTIMAQQLFGGHGYIVETGMEQFPRDCRVLMVGEGANAIQANDLVFRSVRSHNHETAREFISLIEEDLRKAPEDDILAAAMSHSLNEWQEAIERIAKADVETASLHAYALLTLTGYVALGYQWMVMAEAARKRIAEGGYDTKVAHDKLLTARFYAEQILPLANAQAVKIRGSADFLMEVGSERF